MIMHVARDQFRAEVSENDIDCRFADETAHAVAAKEKGFDQVSPDEAAAACNQHRCHRATFRPHRFGRRLGM
jgi:hypothetical protein